MNFIDCCRLCLRDLVSLEHEEEVRFYSWDGGWMVGDRLLQDLIVECFQISLTENEFVTKVCGGCYDDVLLVDNIRKRIQDTDAAIKTYYSELDIKPNVNYEFLEDGFETTDSQSEVLSNDDAKTIEFIDIGNKSELSNLEIKLELSENESDAAELTIPLKRCPLRTNRKKHNNLEINQELPEDESVDEKSKVTLKRRRLPKNRKKLSNLESDKELSDDESDAAELTIPLKRRPPSNNRKKHNNLEINQELSKDESDDEEMEMPRKRPRFPKNRKKPSDVEIDQELSEDSSDAEKLTTPLKHRPLLKIRKKRNNLEISQELPEDDSDDEEMKMHLKRRRLQKSRKKKRVFACCICVTEFDTRDELDDHLPTHVGTVSQQCPICSEPVMTVRHLNQHLQRTHYRKGKLIPCEQCRTKGITREFAAPDTLEAHVKKVHEGVVEASERVFICTFCGKNFNRASALRIHENIHTKAVSFKCKFCPNFTTYARNSLLRHERIHTAEKPFKCELCGRRFNQSTHLNAHRVIHSQDRPWFCEVCGENTRFKSKTAYERHMRNHESSDKAQEQKVVSGVEEPVEKELKCSFCPAVYSWEKHFCRHIVDKHPTEKFPMISCEVCAAENKNSFFLTPEGLNKHLENHVKRDKVVKKDRPCNVCGKIFQTNEALFKHRETHRTHVCSVCGKTFKGRPGLRLHYLTIHLESRPFKCDKCDASYGQLTMLTAHIKHHHP